VNRQERSDIYADVTATIMEALESGTAPWHKPWRAGQLPLSISTGKPYRGINPVLLNMAGGIAGYASPWWGTFGKIAEKSGMVKIMNLGRERWMSPDGQPRGVRKGEKSTMVTFWKKIMVDDRDNPGRKRPVFMLRVYRVFNAEQADWPDGAPAYETRDRNEGERIHEAEQMVKGYLARGGPGLSEGGDRAYYHPASDTIRVPRFADHDGPDEFYSTVFHECGHSTGHASRLNRPGIAELDHFGSGKYAKEELAAEFTAAMLCGITGITTAVDNSAAYLRGWLSRLAADPKLAVQAAGLAQRAADLIQGISYADRDAGTEE